MNEKPLRSNERPEEPEALPFHRPGLFTVTIMVGETSKSFTVRDDLMVFASAYNDVRQDAAAQQASETFTTAYRTESQRVHGPEAHGVPPEVLTRLTEMLNSNRAAWKVCTHQKYGSVELCSDADCPNSLYLQRNVDAVGLRVIGELAREAEQAAANGEALQDHAAACGHRSYMSGLRCAEMTCSNYAGRNVGS